MRAIILSLLILAAGIASAAEDLSGSIIDKYDVEMKLDKLRLVKAGEGDEVIALESLPMAENANIWLAMVREAVFTLDGQDVKVKVALQTAKREVYEDVVKDAALYWFEGVLAEGARQGNKIKIPLREAKVLNITTQFVPPVVAGEGGAMPAQNENVLWVNSVPPGAEVFIKARGDKDFKSIGKTPVKISPAPGKIDVRIGVPKILAVTLKPQAKPEDADSVFEYEGATGLGINNQNNIEYFEYSVQKREGVAATVIAIFQKKGLTLKEALEALPAEKTYKFNEKKLEGVLLNRGIDKREVASILEGLARGGKIVWHGRDKSLIIELVPGTQGWVIKDGAKREGK